ncbi:hypothetical protein ACHAXS_002509 [Conticribra weissflogii]
MTETTIHQLISLETVNSNCSNIIDDGSACSQDTSVKTYPAIDDDDAASKSSRASYDVASSTKTVKKKRTKKINSDVSVIDNEGKMTAFEYLYMSKTGKPLKRSSESAQSDENNIIKSLSKPKLFASDAANNYYLGVLTEEFEEASEENNDTEEVHVLSVNKTIDYGINDPSSLKSSKMKMGGDSAGENSSRIGDLVSHKLEEDDNVAERVSHISSSGPLKSEDSTNTALDSAVNAEVINPEDNGIESNRRITTPKDLLERESVKPGASDDSDIRSREQFSNNIGDTDEASAMSSLSGSVRSFHNCNHHKRLSIDADDASAQGSVRGIGSQTQNEIKFDVEIASAEGSTGCSVRSVRSIKHKGFSKDADVASACDADETSLTGSVRSVHRKNHKRPSHTANDASAKSNVYSPESKKVDDASMKGSVRRSVSSSKQDISPLNADDASVRISICGSTRSVRRNSGNEFSPSTDFSAKGSTGSFRRNSKQEGTSFDFDDASVNISTCGSIGSIKMKKSQGPDASVGSTAAESMSQSSSSEVSGDSATYDKVDQAAATKLNSTSSVRDLKEEETSEASESGAGKSMDNDGTMENLTMPHDKAVAVANKKKKSKSLRAKDFLKRVLINRTPKAPRARPPVCPVQTKQPSSRHTKASIENNIEGAHAVVAPSMSRDIDMEPQLAINNDSVDGEVAASNVQRAISLNDIDMEHSKIVVDFNHPIKTEGEDHEIIECNLSFISKCDSSEVGVKHGIAEDVSLLIEPLEVEVSLLDMLEDEHFIDEAVEIGCEVGYTPEEQHSTKLNNPEPIQIEKNHHLRKATSYEEKEFCDLKPLAGSLLYNDSNTNRVKSNLTKSESFNCSCGTDIKSVIEDTKSSMKEINLTLTKHFLKPLARKNCTEKDALNAAGDGEESDDSNRVRDGIEHA